LSNPTETALGVEGSRVPAVYRESVVAKADTSNVRERSGDPIFSESLHRLDQKRSVAIWATCWAVLVVTTGVLGFTTLFSTFASYDDDGYFLITIKGYLDGATLYDQTSAQYGPFYFEFMAGAFKALGLAVSNDNGRLIALGLWFGASLLLATAAYRLSRSLVLAAVVYVLAFYVLRAAPAEPSHPGHLLMFLLAAMIGTALLPRQRLAFVLLGALVAAALLSKVNIGVLAIAALVFACVLASPRLMRSRALVAIVSTGYVLVPVVLMNHDAWQPGYRVYCLHVLLGALCVAIVALGTARQHDSDAGAVWWLSYAAVGAVGLALIVCGVVLAQGTSLSGLAHGIVLDALDQPHLFSIPLALPTNTILTDAVAVAVAAAVALSALPHSPQWRTVGAFGRLVAGLWIWVEIVGSQPLGMPVALAWVAAVPTRGEASTPARRFIRLFVPALAVLQVLHAYPVAGSQIEWGALLLVVVGAVCLGDGLAELGLSGLGLDGAASRLATAGALGLVVWAGAVALAFPLRDSVNAYRAGVALQTGGAAWIRLPLATAQEYESVVATIRRRCRTFVSMPGLGSLYLMSRETPPTWMHGSDWLFFWNDRTQQRIVDQVRNVAGLCAVRYPALEASWAQGRPIPDRPLRYFILHNFQTIATIGDFLVMGRTGT
jgi:hypothetical protein